MIPDKHTEVSESPFWLAMLDHIPQWLHVGMAINALQDLGLTETQIEQGVFHSMLTAYLQELEKQNEAEYTPQEFSTEDRKAHYQECMEWLRRELNGADCLSYVHPLKGRQVTRNPRYIADILSERIGNPGVTEAHIRQLLKRE